MTKKERILKLRKDGKTYNEIVDIVGCAKSTVSYYCGDSQPEKIKRRKSVLKLTEKYVLCGKIDLYLGRKNKYQGYVKRGEDHKKIYQNIINNPYCYITGRKINLADSSSYSIDHIIPYSISKDNSINNAGLCCREANQAKSNMLLKDFLKLCNEIAKYNRMPL